MAQPGKAGTRRWALSIQKAHTPLRQLPAWQGQGLPTLTPLFTGMGSAVNPALHGARQVLFASPSPSFHLPHMHPTTHTHMPPSIHTHTLPYTQHPHTHTLTHPPQCSYTLTLMYTHTHLTLMHPDTHAHTLTCTPNTHTHTPHTLTLTHTYTHPNTHPHPNTPIHAPSRSHTLTCTLYSYIHHTHTHTLTHTYSHPNIHTYTLTFVTFTHTHSHALQHSHTHTLTCTDTLTPSTHLSAPILHIHIFLLSFCSFRVLMRVQSSSLLWALDFSDYFLTKKPPPFVKHQIPPESGTFYTFISTSLYVTDYSCATLCSADGLQ